MNSQSGCYHPCPLYGKLQCSLEESSGLRLDQEDTTDRSDSVRSLTLDWDSRL